MTEEEFNRTADATLDRLDAALDGADADLDWEAGAGGIIEIEFAGGAKIIVNRHSAAREIWVAAQSGGFHFRYDGSRWVDSRDGKELFARLSALVSEQAGQAVLLSP